MSQFTSVSQLPVRSTNIYWQDNCQNVASRSERTYLKHYECEGSFVKVASWRARKL